jgi:hypothetical protein
LIAVGLVKKALNLSAEVVATVTFSEKEPLLKNLAESDARKVEILLKTVTFDEPIFKGSGLDKGEEGEGREVERVIDELTRDRA